MKIYDHLRANGELQFFFIRLATSPAILRLMSSSKITVSFKIISKHRRLDIAVDGPNAVCVIKETFQSIIYLVTRVTIIFTNTRLSPKPLPTKQRADKKRFECESTPCEEEMHLNILVSCPWKWIILAVNDQVTSFPWTCKNAKHIKWANIN